MKTKLGICRQLNVNLTQLWLGLETMLRMRKSPNDHGIHKNLVTRMLRK